MRLLLPPQLSFGLGRQQKETNSEPISQAARLPKYAPTTHRGVERSSRQQAVPVQRHVCGSTQLRGDAFLVSIPLLVTWWRQSETLV